jgi:hypothetical protein
MKNIDDMSRHVAESEIAETLQDLLELHGFDLGVELFEVREAGERMDLF